MLQQTDKAGMILYAAREADCNIALLAHDVIYTVTLTPKQNANNRLNGKRKKYKHVLYNNPHAIYRWALHSI